MKKRNRNKFLVGGKIQFLFVLLIPCLFSACRTTKFIEDDQSVVRKVDFDFKDGDALVEKTNIEYELAKLVEQPTPKRFLGVYRDYYYFKHNGREDTTWVSNFANKFLAEESHVFDTLGIYSSAANMQSYLRNKKGFYKAEVTSSSKVKRKKAKTKFRIDAGPQYVVDSIFYHSNDPTIKSILEEISSSSQIKKGSPIDASTFEGEKQRIFRNLQDRGYANFLTGNIQLKGDSSNVNQTVNILFDVTASVESDIFKKYYVGEINIFTDFDQDREYPRIPSRVINGKNYYTTNNNFVVKPRSIDKQIFVRSGKIYNRSKHYQTIQKLSTLSSYKFVKVTPVNDLRTDSIVNYNIYLTPHKTKWVSDSGTGAFYSTINSAVGRKLIGLSLDGSLFNRNAFGGSERYELSGEAGLEFEIFPVSGKLLSRNALTLGLSNTVFVPRQVDYFGAIGFLYSSFKTPQETREKYEVATTTKFNASWNFQDVLTAYQINIFTANATYDYKPDDRWSVSFTPSGFNLSYYDITEEFRDSVLSKIPILERSFKSAVFTGILFKEVSAIYEAPESKNGFWWSAFGALELSGGEIFLANTVYNAISGRNDAWGLGPDLDFSNFLKAQIDLRAYKRLNSSSVLAGRMIVGVAQPYGDDDAIPYIRQFQVGGPNSIRAWQSRELGPGGYIETTNPDLTRNQRFFQTGDFKLEMNLEYRFDLFWLLEGALFLDAGNVWSLQESDTRQDAKLRNLYEQAAVGGGYGIRIDFNYFKIRFDFGYKLKTPFKNPDNADKYFQSPVGQGLGNANIAINYPF